MLKRILIGIVIIVATWAYGGPLGVMTVMILWFVGLYFVCLGFMYKVPLLPKLAKYIIAGAISIVVVAGFLMYSLSHLSW